MTEEAPFPITNDLLKSHPVFERAQGILSGWHTQKLQEGPSPVMEWRQAHLDTLEIVDGKRVPDRSEWFWTHGRELAARQILFEFIRCTHHEDPDERMEAWKVLQRCVFDWDEKYANDTDVA